MPKHFPYVGSRYPILEQDPRDTYINHHDEKQQLVHWMNLHLYDADIDELNEVIGTIRDQNTLRELREERTRIGKHCTQKHAELLSRLQF